MALISCRDVSMTYENTVALRDLSFDVAPATTCACWAKTAPARARSSRAFWG